MSVRCSFPYVFRREERKKSQGKSFCDSWEGIIRKHGIENKRWWKYILRREVFMMTSPLWENFPLYDRGSVSLCDAVGPHFSKDKVTFVLDSANRSLTCVRVLFYKFFFHADCVRCAFFRGGHVNRVPTQISELLEWDFFLGGFFTNHDHSVKCWKCSSSYFSCFHFPTLKDVCFWHVLLFGEFIHDSIKFCFLLWAIDRESIVRDKGNWIII